MQKGLHLGKARSQFYQSSRKRGRFRLAGTCRKFEKKHDKIWCVCDEISRWKLGKKVSWQDHHDKSPCLVIRQDIGSIHGLAWKMQHFSSMLNLIWPPSVAIITPTPTSYFPWFCPLQWLPLYVFVLSCQVFKKHLHTAKASNLKNLSRAAAGQEATEL